MLPEYRQLLLQWFSEDEIWQLYGWLGQRDGKLLPPQVMQQTALQIGTAILNREAHDDAVLHALLVLLPSAAYTLAEDFSYRDYLHGAFAMSFTSLPLTEINHKLPARNIIESPWITLQLTLFAQEQQAKRVSHAIVSSAYRKAEKSSETPIVISVNRKLSSNKN